MQRGTLFWGSILVVVGVVILLDNLGIFGNINVWGIIWPLFLIAIGAWILWGSTFRRSAEVEHASIPSEGAQKADLQVQHGAGRIIVNAISTPGTLVEGDFGGGLDVQTKRDGDRVDVRMSVPVQFFPFSWYPGYSLDWNFGVSKDIPLAMEFETGASDNQIDLTDLQVSEIKLKTGASSTRLSLPAHAGATRVSVESGAASVDIHVPPGVAASIHSQSGLSSIDVDQTRFPKYGDAYKSEDYDTAANKADIYLQIGVGSVTVR